MRSPVLAADSVTELGDGVRGAVQVAGSHGGLIAAYLGAKAGAHALILNDAGVGLDEAGIAGLAWLEHVGMAAATVSHLSCRIGDGRDSLARGLISHANCCAVQAGVAVDMRADVAAERLRDALAARGPPPPYAEGRWRIGSQRGTEVWALDSVGKLVPEDEGRILIIGSHGALHGGRRDSALDVGGRPVAARAAAFNDAGGGIDAAGTTRLAELELRGVPAVTVSAQSARIGDGRSMQETGIISCINAAARRTGARTDERLSAWIARL